MKTSHIILALLLMAAAALRAQVVADGATNTLSNITNTFPGDVTVGTNGSFTLLILSDNSLLTNSVNGVIGRNATAKSNEMRLVSATARWRMGGSLFAGSNGASSRLVVSNGALLANGIGIVGNEVSSSNNTVVVNGVGSLWSNRQYMIVGENGGGNTLEASGGGTVYADSGTVGDLSSGNQALVTDSGSLWTNRFDMTVGYLRGGSQMVISNGGTVRSADGYVGRGSNGTNSQALVTGAGSAWISQSGFNLGVSGSRSQVTVDNGGLLADDTGVIGVNFNGTNNLALITGSGSLWSNRLDLLLGQNGRANQLVVSNGAFVYAGGNGAIGINSIAVSNLALVTGTGSLWSNRFDLLVGQNGSANRLTVSDGAAVCAGSDGVIGVSSTAASNSVSVTDPGSQLLLTSTLLVGSNGPLNRLVISNGGFVSDGFGLIGASVGGASNEVMVTGTGSVWSNRLDCRVGDTGPGNQLVVSNGGMVLADMGYVGFFSSSSSNLALVTGPGSLWTNASGLVVGDIGLGNRLVISNGGVVQSLIGYVGLNTPSSNNNVLITDPGSLWHTRNGALFVGLASSTGNRLVISNGAAAVCGLGWLGFDTSPGPNDAVVTSPGSLWNSTNILTVGRLGNRNRLVVSNSATALAGSSIMVGESILSTNNRIVVDGGTLRTTNASGTAFFDVRRGTNVFNSGLIEVDRLLMTNTLGRFEFNGGTLITRGALVSNGVPFSVGLSSANPAVWDVRAGITTHSLAGRLIVGSNSSSHKLFITNGAVLNGAEYTFLAFNAGSNNEVTVAGPASTLNSPSGFFVGADGNGNRMLIQDGGKAIASVGSAGTFIGRSVGTRSNFVMVAGAGSRWSVNDYLYVGSGGNANQLVVSNGAGVDSLIGYVGSASSASNNLATVTGANSVWSNRSEFYVGSSGSGNRLVVSEGGTVINSNAYIGVDLSSRSNLVQVVGPGSLWSNRSDLFVGYDGTFHQLVVSNGGLVSVGGNAFLGLNPTTSTGNRLVVDGGTLLVTNGAGTGLLEVKRGTNVLNAGLIEADILRMTNSQSRFEFNSGTLSIKSSRVSIGPPLLVGDGVRPATFNLAGNGTHDFSGTLGLIVRSNATLTGNGSLVVQLQVHAGAQLVPGASVGKISLSTPPFLSGTVVMEITRNGATVTNDQVQVTGTLTYGGALVVTNLGPTALAPGDKFKLFNATSYAGSFSSLTLPPLDFGLGWTNKLLVDGSIEVTPGPALLISSGSYTQIFNSLANSGAANLWRDNSTLLGWYAAQSLAPFTITNYRASDGSVNSGDLYSFGSSGSSERALGSIPINAMGDVSYGLGFINDTGNTISNCAITYTGEQWRDSEAAVTNTLSFWYRVSPTAITNPEPGVFTNWTEVTGLNFVSPTVLGVATALNGNQETNRHSFTSVFVPGIVVPPGHNVFFRWHDANDAGSDQGMAVDDLIVTFPLPSERFWTNALGGNYEVGSNWLMNAVASQVDTANFTNNANYQVDWLTSAQAARAFFNAQSGTVTQAIGSSAWTVTDAYIVGKDAGTTSAVTHVSGALRVTNSLGDARLVIGESGRGNYTLSGGAVEVDNLFVTNGSASRFTLFSGSLKTRNTSFNQGTSFEVGNFFLTSTATLELLGNGTHTFPNAVTVYPNGTLKGNGSIAGSVFIMGLLSPGASIGQLAISRSLAFDFDSTSFFELNKAAGTNDNIVGLTNIQYQGSLIVTNLAGTLANGDRFPLFTSTRYFPSTFTNIVLPPLDPGLKWRNKLMMDGSLEVLTIPTRDFGVDVSHFQGASGISQASWDQMFAEGKRFVFIKATEGLTGPHDAAMSNNVARATAAGLLAGVYHFAHPENRPTTNGAILEASNMVVYAGSAIGPGRLRPVLDIEGAATTLSTTALTDWVIAFSDEIIARRGPGAAPIIYCTQGSANFEFDSRLANYDLWLRTIGGSNPATDDPLGVLSLDPTGVFNEWSFWQYSDTGSSGGISPLDLDVCHSEYKPLSSFIIPGPLPAPIELTGITLGGGGGFQLNFTNTPGALFTVLATTNVALPSSNWIVLGGVAEISPGQFEFSDSEATNNPQRFYRVRSP